MALYESVSEAIAEENVGVPSVEAMGAMESGGLAKGRQAFYFRDSLGPKRQLTIR